MGLGSYMNIYMFKFEDTSTADSQLRDSFAVMLFDWSRVWSFTSSPNVFYFISCLSHSS